MPAKRRKRPTKSRAEMDKPAKRTPASIPKPVKRPPKTPKRKPPTKPLKRSPKGPKRPKRRKAPPKRRKAPPKRRKAPPKKRKAPPKKRKAPAKKRKSAQRSQAARKGWAKRRKRQRLLDAMADLKMKRADEERGPDEQPIGWILRRVDVREMDGERWQRIAVEFSEDAYDQQRLQVLEDLDIDLLNSSDLYDYLSWAAEHFDIDLSDMYQMYLGYSPGEAAAEPD